MPSCIFLIRNEPVDVNATNWSLSAFNEHLFGRYQLHYRQVIRHRTFDMNCSFQRRSGINVQAATSKAELRFVNAGAICPHKDDARLDPKFIGRDINTLPKARILWQKIEHHLIDWYRFRLVIQNVLWQIDLEPFGAGDVTGLYGWET